MQRPTPSEIEAVSKIFTWIGIINQLSRARITRALMATDLPYPQFVLLTHFSHRPKEAKTITAIARAMQQPQPGVTKTVQKMIKKDFLRMEESREDARARLIYLTAKGQRALERAVQLLVPLFKDTFVDWTEEEMNQLFTRLDRLKVWMDTKGRE
jgi:DNA-binding MarR family transcriptional regulator